MQKKSGMKRFIEVSVVLAIVFVIIMIIFGILNFGFKFIHKTISGNAVSGEVPTSLKNIDWIIITAITAFFVVYALEKMIEKNFININMKD